MVEFDKEKQEQHKNSFTPIMEMTDFCDEIEKQVIKCNQPLNILVIGCGTGLEQERINHPANVTVINVSPAKLREINDKSLKQISLKTITSSIFDFDFGEQTYDLVLSCYALHHFNKLQKLEILQKIHTCLKPNGVFVNGDTMASSLEEAGMRMLEAEEIYAQESLPFGCLHIDVPMTYEQEVRLLNRAGFTSISLEREWPRTKLYRAIR